MNTITKFLLSLIVITTITAHADTPGSGAQRIIGNSDGTKIGNVGDALKTTGSATISGNVPVTQVTSPWVISGNVNASQSGTWTTGRTWSLLNTTDSVNVGNFPAAFGRTWNLLNTTDSVNVGNFPSTFGVTQSTSPWVTSRNWNLLFANDKVDVSGSSLSVSNFPSTFGVTQSTSPWVVSGTVTANIGTTNGLALDSTLSALSAKFNSLGQKTMANSAPVVIASDQSAIPVSQSGTWSTGRTWSLLNTTDSVNVGNFPSTFGVTQSTSPWVVSGTVAATQSGAWSTGRTWSLLNTTDSVNVGNFPASQSVTQGTSPWVVSGTVTANAGTGNFTVVQPTGTNLHAVLDTTSTTAVTQATAANLNATVVQASGANLHVNVDSAPTTTVTGTVTANQGTSPWVSNISQFGGNNVVTGTGASGVGIPRVTVSNDSNVLATQSGTWNINNVSGTVSLPTGAATSANQTGGTQKTQVVDGANATVGPVTTLSAVNYMPVVTASSATSGSAVPARSILVAGSDGTNARNLSTDTSGNVNVNVVSTSSASRTSVNLARNVYSTTNVTTAAYVQLIASTSDTTNQLFVFDSSGQTLVLATGAAASEVDKYYIVPGGNGLINLTIPASTRVSVKAVSATASSGELSITFIK